MRLWFSLAWWKYLLSKPAWSSSRIKSFICRARNHPKGVVWFNPSGTEPDMRCKICGDDLG